jgi:hypothetical protein
MRKIVLLLAMAGALAPTVVAACGGFVPADAGVITQNEQRIIFAVDRAAGEITIYEQIAYTGDASEFAWIIPVPNDPQVAVLDDDAAFRELAAYTRPQFRYPAAPACPEDSVRGPGSSAGSSDGAGGVSVTQQGSVGPYDYAVVGGDDAAAIGDWLRSNRYNLTPAIESKLKVYTDMSMLFLALRLRSEATSAAIQPIQITIKASDPMIPLQLAAIGAAPDTQLNLWFFAEAQIKPTNTKRLLIQPADLSLSYRASGGHSTDYDTVRRGAIQAERGHGLVVQYANTPGAFNDPLLKRLQTTYPVLTKLSGEMSPEEMTIDLMFASYASLPPVSNVFDLAARPSPRVCERTGSSVAKPAATSSTARAVLWAAGIVGGLALLLGIGLVLLRARE